MWGCEKITGLGSLACSGILCCFGRTNAFLSGNEVINLGNDSWSRGKIWTEWNEVNCKQLKILLFAYGWLSMTCNEQEIDHVYPWEGRRMRFSDKNAIAIISGDRISMGFLDINGYTLSKCMHLTKPTMSLDNMNMAFVVINYCINSWFIQDKVKLNLKHRWNAIPVCECSYYPSIIMWSIVMYE